MARKNLLSGIYKHYKGKHYLVLGLGQHSETNEELVIYVPLYIQKGPRIFARPLKMFFEKVQVNGKKVARFEYIGSQISSL